MQQKSESTKNIQREILIVTLAFRNQYIGVFIPIFPNYFVK